MTNGDLGANEWLVDEMFESYSKDPNSVDPVWRDYFLKTKGSNGSAPTNTQTASVTQAASTNQNGSSLAGAPRGGVPPIPKADTGSIAPQFIQQTSAPVIQQTSVPIAPPAQPAEPIQQVQQVPPTQVPPTQVSQQEVLKQSFAPAATPADPIVKPAPLVTSPGSARIEVLRGVSGRVVQSMEASLSVPTATSVRAIPAKLLIDNRIVINNHLKRGRGGKVSFTHLIAYAMIKAIRKLPEMNTFFTEQDGKPAVGYPEHINLGIAIDLAKEDGTRQLLVPSIKGCENLDFAQFWNAYEETVKKARNGQLTVEDFSGTTVSLTNPGTIGTVHSVPRLVQGQGLILGVGAMDYPAEFQGASEETLNNMGVGKVVTLTSTYDHRIIQGAQSGDFLRIINEELISDEFYREVFEAVRVPYAPIKWFTDVDSSTDDDIDKAGRVQQLIQAYRSRGHLIADVDPLTYEQREHPDVDVRTYGLTLWDLDRVFPTGGFGGKSKMKLREILGILRNGYCRTTSVQFTHIQNPEERKWIQDRFEARIPKMEQSRQLHILRKLNSAEAFETFLQTKFVGQKRFSLEGGESVIPLLDAVLSAAADAKLDEVCIGMPHRGRLNVLANIAGKSHGQIFQEFEGHYAENEVQGSGDVKYHLGTEGVFTAANGASTKVYLAANPSHLEAVNPVLEGIVRAKQDKLNIKQAYSVMPILIHGDAAFAGQGVVAETMQFSQLSGYRTGGTMHIIINNQVGFTTSPNSSRTSLYATDVAKMVQAPIFRVNGDDPEACVRVAEIAFAYREAFHKDVVIDMICYRRRGHNEGDEPSFTQPMMYRLIDAKRTTRTLYAESLVGRGDITPEQNEAISAEFSATLESIYNAVHDTEPENPIWNVPKTPEANEVQTAITEETARKIAATQVAIPEGFTVHPKLLPQLQRRVEMLNDGTIDWGMGEILAYGSLIQDGHPVRIAGQDARRGTFSHRHAVVIDKENGSEWTPLRALTHDDSHFFVVDSLLSEYAALGFEYGYSTERPDALVIWEAQFGDFANGAQTVIDEFISSSLQKWGERSSVVMALPHGYEGQGPDHSSARIERYLQLCAEQNMTVAQTTSPAQHFHLLRWHVNNPARRPLIAFTPKSMLRMKAAASKLSDFTSGTFQPVIDDPTVQNATRLIFCSGRIYYDLIAERERLGENSTAIVRVELLYPLPAKEMAEIAAKHPNANLLWVQDEPANQGPWSFIALRTAEQFGGRGFGGRTLRRVSRRATASPATGNHHLHEVEQKSLLLEAFTR